MTLVAALQAHGVPILMGDLMITGTGRSSTRRKIMRLRPNFAIGWSGALIAATTLLRDLDEQLPPNVTVHEFQSALQRSAHEIGCLELQLAGWILEDESTAFMWDSSYPQELVTGKRFLIGSGTGVLWPFLESQSLDGPHPTHSSAVEHASFQALTVVGNLMKSDLSDRATQRQSGFGVAYDLLIAAGGRFRYVSPVVYAAMATEVDHTGRIGKISRPWGVGLVRNVGEHTVCQIGRNTEGNMDIDLISPPFSRLTETSRQRLERVVVGRNGPFVFEGDYCVLFTQFVEGSTPWPPFVGVIRRDAPVWLRSHERGVDLAISGYLEAAAKVMAERRQGRW